MRVLVTGACGVLGAATVAALAARGHRVRGFDRPGKAATRIARTLPPEAARRAFATLDRGQTALERNAGIKLVAEWVASEL